MSFIPLVTDQISEGYVILITGLLIVFCSLLILSLFFKFGLPIMLYIYKVITKRKDKKISEIKVDADQEFTGEIAGAISAAIHIYLNEQHDHESAILTIKQVKNHIHLGVLKYMEHNIDYKKMKNFKFRINSNNYKVNIKSHEGNVIDLEVNGTSFSVQMEEEIKKTKTPTLVRAASQRPAEPLKVNPSSLKTKIVAPIGVVMSIDVKVGDTLKVGDRMLVLEAMKMENNIVCEKAGTITALHISVGQQVLQNEVMIELG